MKSINIEIPKGFKVKSFDKETGEIKFETTPKSIKERIQSLYDAINELGEDDSEVIEYRKLQKAKVLDSTLAHQEIIIIIKAFNEGWTPDWTDTKQRKYFPYFYMGSGFSYIVYDYWDSGSFVGSRLCFKSSDLAKYAGEQFTEVYEKFMLIK